MPFIVSWSDFRGASSAKPPPLYREAFNTPAEANVRKLALRSGNPEIVVSISEGPAPKPKPKSKPAKPRVRREITVISSSATSFRTFGHGVTETVRRLDGED